jgi:hypothetical protein
MSVKVFGPVQAIYLLYRKMRLQDRSIHINNSTHTDRHIEAPGIERREFALNGDAGGWMERAFALRLVLRLQDALAAGDVVEDALHEDDAYVNAAGHVGEELVEEIIDGVEAIAGEDAGNRGCGVG